MNEKTVDKLKRMVESNDRQVANIVKLDPYLTQLESILASLKEDGSIVRYDAEVYFREIDVSLTLNDMKDLVGAVKKLKASIPNLYTKDIKWDDIHNSIAIFTEEYDTKSEFSPSWGERIGNIAIYIQFGENSTCEYKDIDIELKDEDILELEIKIEEEMEKVREQMVKDATIETILVCGDKVVE